MDESLAAWLEALAAKRPTPGGGAAAALAAATASGLVGMVSVYTTGEKWQKVDVRMHEVNSAAATLRHRAIKLIQADEAAFQSVGTAYKLPKITEAEKAARAEAIQQALVGAARPPMLTAELAAEIVPLCEYLAENANPNVVSDVAVAASFTRAALEAAIVNIEINESMLEDSAAKKPLQAAVKHATSILPKADAVIAHVRERIVRS